MKRLLTILFLLISSVLYSQTTTTTGTIVFPDANTFANGTVQAIFLPPGGTINQNLYKINGNSFAYYVNGVMNGSGTFSIVLTDDHLVRPQGGRWRIIVCSVAPNSCYSSIQDVFGASIDLSSTINSTITNLSAPGQNIPIYFADSELRPNPNGGTMYFNYTTKVYRCYDGTSWGACGGGGGSTSWPSLTFPNSPANTATFPNNVAVSIQNTNGEVKEFWIPSTSPGYNGIGWQAIAINGTNGGQLQIYSGSATCLGNTFDHGSIELTDGSGNNILCIGNDTNNGKILVMPDSTIVDAFGDYTQPTGVGLGFSWESDSMLWQLGNIPSSSINWGKSGNQTEYHGITTEGVGSNITEWDFITAPTTAKTTDCNNTAANTTHFIAFGTSTNHAGSVNTPSFCIDDAGWHFLQTTAGSIGAVFLPPTLPVNSNNTQAATTAYVDRVLSTVRVTSDFTTNSATLVPITGLSFTLPANTAANYRMTCDLIEQASAAANIAYGLQDVTTAPTQIRAYAEYKTNTNAYVSNFPATWNTITATAFGSHTPTATTTLSSHQYALIEQPSGAASVIQLMGQIAGGNTLTIFRGSSCSLTTTAN